MAQRHALPATPELTPYGLRTVEPHHDACPHWHALLFAPPEQLEAILHTLRAYALADSPDELRSAQVHSIRLHEPKGRTRKVGIAGARPREVGVAEPRARQFRAL